MQERNGAVPPPLGLAYAACARRVRQAFLAAAERFFARALARRVACALNAALEPFVMVFSFRCGMGAFTACKINSGYWRGNVLSSGRTSSKRNTTIADFFSSW